MSVADTVRHASRSVVAEEYSCLGYNYRLTDLQAAVGREQLKRLPAIVARRRRLAAQYADLLRGVEVVHPPQEPGWARSNWQSYCVRLSDGIRQAEVMQALLDRGIATRRGVMCAHREPAYRHEEWRAGSRLVESEAAADRCILLPLYPQLTDAEQQEVVDALRAACAAAR
jgi:dTDP-4-amino-4,6-dideoxygalactose transaminase